MESANPLRLKSHSLDSVCCTIDLLYVLIESIYVGGGVLPHFIAIIEYC